MSGFTKLYSSIVLSTIWREPHTTRIIWITMLAMADRHGMVSASIPGLADLARVSLDDTKAALAAFMQPDEYSRSQEDEGRRIKTVDGGWVIINHRKYREDPSDRMQPADEKEGKIYFIRCGKFIKIGFSQNPWARLAGLKTGMPHEPKLIGYFHGVFSEESELHERFKAHLHNREWFRASKEILDYVAERCATTATVALRSNYNTEAEAYPDAEAEAETKAEAETSPKAKALRPRSLDAISVPESLSGEDFKKAWSDWFEYRRQAKLKPYTTIGARNQLAELDAMGTARAIAAINHSIAQGWQGIHEPKNGNGHSKHAEAESLHKKTNPQYGW